MIQEADAVVIGSGALGSSVAFHLARAGRQVAVVEKHAIASQTSPRAAGLTAQVRGDMLMTRLAMQGVRKIERFTEETGEPME
ncbi:MAG TPA: FAD-dependent oxidoreductase, partial [Acetobacteraceae bacterium]|nr:FAD-dependent oxidoreductase [Acetobacteraceae bacterium]